MATQVIYRTKADGKVFGIVAETLHNTTGRVLVITGPGKFMVVGRDQITRVPSKPAGRREAAHLNYQINTWDPSAKAEVVDHRSHDFYFR